MNIKGDTAANTRESSLSQFRLSHVRSVVTGSKRRSSSSFVRSTRKESLTVYSVRVVRSTDPQKPANIRDYTNMNKREALKFISTLGKISTIVKLHQPTGPIYVVTPAK